MNAVDSIVFSVGPRVLCHWHGIRFETAAMAFDCPREPLFQRLEADRRGPVSLFLLSRKPAVVRAWVALAPTHWPHDQEIAPLYRWGFIGGGLTVSNHGLWLKIPDDLLYQAMAEHRDRAPVFTVEAMP